MSKFDTVGSYECRTFKSEVLHEEYKCIYHRSGLPIYIFPKKMRNTYALLATRYGSVDNSFFVEGENKIIDLPEGVAHFLEHKMFTDEEGGDALDVFSEYGADANAYTSYDKTVYLFSCIDNFKECLSELLRFVTHPHFTKESVKKEQGIIAEEIRMYDDSPGTRSYYAMLDGLYKTHPIKQNICGSVDSIKKITPELLYKCYDIFYRMSNMALVICGDVKEADIIEIADRILPQKTPCEIKVIKHRESEARCVNFPYKKQKMQLAKPLFDIGIKDADIPSTPEGRARRGIIRSIINDLLFSQTGELYNTLYSEGLISPGMSGSYTISEDFAFDSVSGEADNPEDVAERIKAYVKKKSETGFTEEEFGRCKKVFYASFVREFDSTDDISNNLLSFVFDGYELFEYTDIISSITCDEVNEMLKAAFRDEYYTLSVIYPID